MLFLQVTRAIHRSLPGGQRSWFPCDATSWRTSPSRNCGNPYYSGIQAKDVWQEADSNAGHRGKPHPGQCTNAPPGVPAGWGILHQRAALGHTSACAVVVLLLLRMDKNKTKFGELTDCKLGKHTVFYTVFYTLLQFLHYPFAISTRGRYLILIPFPQLHRQHDFHRESK